MRKNNQTKPRPLRRKKRAKARPRLNLPSWMREKVKFLMATENRETFFARIGEIFPETDPRYRLIARAYETAKDEFGKRKIFRSDGTRYFEHLRAVALILIVYLRVRDAEMIAAALLHDLVEDLRPAWSIARVRREFGDRVAELVYWLTKPEQGKRYPTKEEVDRKYHRSLRDAPRDAAIIKLADRLHNLITLWQQEWERMRDKVSETRDFILPLAEKHTILIHEIEDILRIVEKRYGF
jgi:guanosine-3',5'-bis(diphosphate) 3'-pyrophosphohydrolase